MLKVEATLESVATGLNYVAENIDGLREEFHAARTAAEARREETAERISDLESKTAAQIAGLEARVEGLSRLLWWALGLAGTAAVGLIVEGAFLAFNLLNRG